MCLLKKSSGFGKFSPGQNFSRFWSQKKFRVSRIMYCSRSLHFWGLWLIFRRLGVPRVTPSMGTKQNTKLMALPCLGWLGYPKSNLILCQTRKIVWSGRARVSDIWIRGDWLHFVFHNAAREEVFVQEGIYQFTHKFETAHIQTFCNFNSTFILLARYFLLQFAGL